MAVASVPTTPTLVPPLPPPTGDLRDVGAALRDSVRAHSYTAVGAVKILGAFEAGAADLRGTITIGTRFQAERARSDGTLDVAGDLRVQGELSVRGSTRVGGTLAAGDLRASGTLEVGQAVTVEAHAVIHGEVAVHGTLTARSLEFDGTIHASGLIDCPMIQGRLRGPSRLGTIRSQHVRIVRAAFPFGRRGQLVVDRIEATEVALEGVTCEYLRAERVSLGPDCQVTRVDGQVVRRHRSSVVGPVAWEAPPPGLTR
ncbi:MAG: polymer-forming cytoskeletal protein [Thermoplasmata archaeon]|nr:polymer-forming cytoskeletal protein [Thermoplasmata archaeon]